MKTFHPIANIFPLLDGKALDDLVTDIKFHGLREPIVLHPDDRILDGRNREWACELAGIAPRYRTWSGEGSAVDFVLSLNLHRRHLSIAQRGLVAAKIANLSRGGVGGVVNTSADVLRISELDASKLLDVSVASVQRARNVLNSEDHELINRVAHGDLPLNTANAIVKEKQRVGPALSAPAPSPKEGGRMDTSRAAIAKRVEAMTKLAAVGYTSEQIADKLGVSVEYCRGRMDKAGIDRRADRVVGIRRRKINATRLADRIVWGAECQFENAELINWTEIDPANFKPWLERLALARRELDGFIKALAARERQHVTETAQDNGDGGAQEPDRVQALRGSD